MRGNPPAQVRKLLRAGPIPACAGQPLCTVSTLRFIRAYPRVCGATLERPRSFTAVVGLSPRVRGNRDAQQQVSDKTGPIPACAGQPTPSASKSITARAYPRVCGATPHIPFELALRTGLSPRVRGNLQNSQDAASVMGPIPACAGQPGRCYATWLGLGAYPRVCGATGIWMMADTRPLGLSPRVRGNLCRNTSQKPCRGPIPACAGQPSLPAFCLFDSRAYPRVCGATAKHPWRYSSKVGLSPRVRGNPLNRIGTPAEEGPIPACAGQPPWEALGMSRRRAYPRVCGATHLEAERRHELRGLSPRVRGNPLKR